jgi:hypothetical protein
MDGDPGSRTRNTQNVLPGRLRQAREGFKTRIPKAWGESVREPASAIGETPDHQEIAVRAYELYLESGCQAGRDVEFWLAVEPQLTSR